MRDFHKKGLLPIAGALLALALFALLLALTYRFDNKYTAGPPYGEDGVMAFTRADLGRPLFLIDGWKLNGQEVFIGEYSNFSFLPGGSSPFGAGDYRLTLRYDGPPTALLLEIPPIFTEYTLLVNGTPAAQTGSGGMVSIPVGGDTALELRTVNRSHYYSGLTYPPAIGTPAVMNRLFLIRTLVYAALCVTALTLAVFSLVLWFSRARDKLFRHFGTLCLAFAVHCLHPFVWQLFGYSAFGYAVEDVSWLLVLAQAAALGGLCAGLERKSWYRRGVRPIPPLFCLFCFCSILFIIPKAGSFVNFYGAVIDWYKLAVWAWLALCAAAGLADRPGGTSFFTLSACGVLGVSLLAGIGDSNAFEPIYGAWQNEYAGFALVLLFGALMVRRNAQLLRQSAELQSVKLQNRFAAESAAQTRASIAQVRSLKHELRHHVETLEALYANRDYLRLGAYLAELGAEKDALPQLYYTENFLVNAILAGRLGPAREKGVRVECRVRVPEELPIADADLCTLLANLLDNAAEACERLPESADRFIQLSLEARQELLLVTCANSALPVTAEADRLPTSKSDPDSHGLGIPAMRRVAEKYDGALEVSQTGGVFTLRAVLHLG
ncbi:sensor histidine kinase [uncultured Oscillibacter sp.]|uniref:sensor histidine kinase n=1 Tax=uncultured Oscillibacter sp. TaxID=876091 RepID=UPI0025F4B8EE|nr:ATP-binding protein [uncultured Oscillibacter sp.]